MSRSLRWLKDEFIEVLPVVVFFFLVFNMRFLTDILMYGKLPLTNPLDQAAILVKALLVSKVLLLSDLLPFMKAFDDRPLIWITLWKTLIYSIAGIVFRLLDALLRLVSPSGGWRPAIERLAHQDWARFWGVQIWLTAVLLLFVAARELILAVGGGRVVRRMFLSRRPASP
jgi:hypothetical protein